MPVTAFAFTGGTRLSRAVEAAPRVFPPPESVGRLSFKVRARLTPAVDALRACQQEGKAQQTVVGLTSFPNAPIAEFSLTES